MRNEEDMFLKRTCKYPCSFAYIAIEASSLCTEGGRIDILQVGLCMVIFKTLSINTNRHVTLDTSEYHRSLRTNNETARDV